MSHCVACGQPTNELVQASRLEHVALLELVSAWDAALNENIDTAVWFEEYMKPAISLAKEALRGADRNNGPQL